MLQAIGRRWPFLVDMSTAVGLVLAASLLCVLLSYWVRGLGLSAIYTLAILLAALSRGMLAAVAAAIVSAAALNFFVAEPHFRFHITVGRDLLTLATFGGCAIVASFLIDRRAKADEQARLSARRLEQMLTASQMISSESQPARIAAILRDQIAVATGADCGVWLVDEGGALRLAAPAAQSELPADMAALASDIERGWPDGPTMPFPPHLCWQILEIAGRPIGALLWRECAAANPAHHFDTQIVPVLGDIAAAGILRARAVEDSMAARMQQKTEELRSTFLSSLSHDLRTPLSSILAATTGLLDHGDRLSPSSRRDMLTTIREESERLNRYFGTILDLVQIESGGAILHTQPTDLVRLVGDAVARRPRQRDERVIDTKSTADTIMVNTDPVLLEQAVVNLIDNAAKYSPVDSPVHVSVEENATGVLIKVRDEGPGIPAKEIGAIFGRFFRGNADQARIKGHGLGLAICKAIVSRLDGDISVLSPPLGCLKGSEFSISLKRR